MKVGLWKKTLRFAAIVAILIVVVVSCSSLVPTPPPKVALIFQGFAPQTNYAPIPGLEQIMMVQVRLTNEGKTRVWLEDTNWISITSEKLDGEKPDEQINESIFAAQKVPPHSNAVLRIGTLPTSPKWRVTVSYTYYKVYPLKRILREQIIHSALLSLGPDPVGKFQNAIFKIVMWTIHFLPDPVPQQAEISTPFLTNQAPSGSSFPNQ